MATWARLARLVVLVEYYARLTKQLSYKVPGLIRLYPCRNMEASVKISDRVLVSWDFCLCH